MAELKGLTKDNIDMETLDKTIRRFIPAGFKHRDRTHLFIKDIDLDALHAPMYNRERVELSLGSLGGGNHFIELNQDETGKLYLIIHSGSRSLGQDVAKWHQKKAVELWLEQTDHTEKGE